MKARELADLLLRVPDADVRIESIFLGQVPPLLEMQHIAMNNEANCWLITHPPAQPQNPEDNARIQS